MRPARPDGSHGTLSCKVFLLLFLQKKKALLLPFLPQRDPPPRPFPVLAGEGAAGLRDEPLDEPQPGAPGPAQVGQAQGAGQLQGNAR